VTVRKDALLKAVVASLSQAHSITLPGGLERVASGPAPSVDVSVQVVRGNKNTTHIRGLEELLGPDALARTRDVMAKRFASACSIGPCTNNPKIREVVVQGNMAREVEDLLEDVFGLPRALVKTEIGKGVAAKKRSK
jgi:translation initiation factor 1 (eIF-1/SUI1)